VRSAGRAHFAQLISAAAPPCRFADMPPLRRRIAVAHRFAAARRHSYLVMRKLAFGSAGRTIRLVVIATHHEIDALFANEIDQAVLLSNASGPDAAPEVLQWLRFADPAEWIAHDRFDEVQDP
jgi:hypothetical protein